MSPTFSHEFNTPSFKGKVNFPTGLYINGKFVDGADKSTIDVVNPTNGQVVTKIAEGTAKDVDAAVDAAQKAFDTVWGLKASGGQRARLLTKLWQAMEAAQQELAALEVLDNGT
ncbi:hypothetical protein AAF712_003711 [Marasmius tenuissimus]|uniref:Aldehyde dehydrogenase domain-containing protein n=1 Tax=Marasmius tenuissimus TaxID=585030 RepID=A0ABR3A7R2_9AGAR